jgi:hypothetical protein
MSLIKILPLPNGKNLTDTHTTVNDLSCNTDLPESCINGTYEATSSSYSNGQKNISNNTKAFNAFNANPLLWQCDYFNNSNYDKNTFPNSKYTQNPYTGASPSSYQGGGQINNTYSTTITNNDTQTNIKGEWLQIKLPYKIYLSQYSILTPTSKKINTFPKKFLVVGSNDGKTWNYIDQRNLQTVPTEYKLITYKTASSDKYSYFRLIISEMDDGNTNVAIQLWKLVGTFFLSVNKEPFAQMSQNVSISSSMPDYYDINNKLLSSTTYSSYQPMVKAQHTETPSTVEGFNTYGYNMPVDNNPDAVSKTQITPLEQISADYSNAQNQINAQYNNIGVNIDKITNSTNTGLRDIMMNDPKYDFSGNLLNYINKKPSLADARQADSKIMLVEQNSIYIFGSIAAASLLILAIVIARE